MKTWHRFTKKHIAQVLELVRAEPGLNAAQISNRLTLPHGQSTVCMQLTNLNNAGKVHRERTGRHHEYLYYPPMSKARGKAEPEHKVVPPEVAVSADVLIVVPVGSNKSATLTLAEARRVYDQLAAVFKN
jgi:hypothetical protein